MRVFLLLVFSIVTTACGGGGGGSGGDSGTSGDTAPIKSLSINTTSSIVTTPSVYLTGRTFSCEGCPASKDGYGYCPDITCPATTSSSVSWTNSDTNESGVAQGAVSSTCHCLSYYCISSCELGFSATVPITFGENNIFFSKNVPAYNGDTVVITRVPNTPNGVEAVAKNGSISVSWSGVPDAETYNIYWSTSKYINTDTADKISGVTSPYTVTGLPDNETYFFRVTAANSDVESLASEVVQATLGITVPGDLGSILSPNGSIELLWVASSATNGVLGYRIFRNGIEYTDVVLPGYTDTAINPDTRYCYTVLAYDQTGKESPISNVSCSNPVWSTSIVDDSSSYELNSYNDIVAGPSGDVHIAYVSPYNDVGDRELKYAVKLTDSWGITTVESCGSYGCYGPSMVIDSYGSVYINYESIGISTNILKYASNASGSWTTESLAESDRLNSTPFNSLAVDSQNHLHVGYQNLGLQYLTNKSGAWEKQSVAMPDEWISIAVDSDNHVHLCSSHLYPVSELSDANNDKALFYTTNRTGHWITEPVDIDDSGIYNSLALDVNGDAHISYCGWHSGKLRYATNKSGTWISEVVDDGHCEHTSIALDTSGNAHISYRGGSYLRYATNATGAWQIDTIDRSYGTAIAVDNTDDVHISYDTTGHKLGYATTR